jgi:membrane associated rhomboid family serine protease
VTDPHDVDAPPTCYRHPNRPTYVSCQRCGRPICPECSTQAAVGVQCPECVRGGASVAQRRASSWTQALRPRRSIVTYVLMGIIVVAYALQWITQGGLTDAWILDPSRVGAEPWRLVTSAFLHSPGFVLHIVFNLYALYAFGPPLEAFLGRVRFLALYLLAAIGGSLGVLAIYQLAIATNGASIDATGGFLQPGLTLGASGAIFGLMGAYLPLRRAIGVNLTQLLIVLAINVGIGFVVSGIAWEAHLGGLLVGALIAYAYVRTRRREQRRTQVLLVVGVAVALLVVFAAFVLSAPAFYGI